MSQPLPQAEYIEIVKFRWRTAAREVFQKLPEVRFVVAQRVGRRVLPPEMGEVLTDLLFEFRHARPGTPLMLPARDGILPRAGQACRASALVAWHHPA